MKNLIALFSLIFFAATVHGQSLNEKEISGNWLIRTVLNANDNPKMEQEMESAYMNLYPDHSFNLKIKTDKKGASHYKTISSTNASWSYNESTQTIEIPKEKMTLKVSQANGEVFFENIKTGVIFEVFKPS